MCVCVYLFVKIVRIGHTLVKITDVENDACKFWLLPSNGVIAKFPLRDLDLLFNGKKNCYISETVRDSAKNVRNICRLWHLPSNGVFEKIAIRDLHILLEVKNENIYISETVRARANVWKTFVDFDNCRQMASWRKLYFVIFIFFLKDKILKC